MKALRTPLGATLSLCFGLLAVYGRVLSYPWVWDDKNLIRDNLLLQRPDGLALAFTSDFWGFAGAAQESGMYRPVVMASYWLEATILHQRWEDWGPTLGHTVNLVASIVIALLIASLARRAGADRVPSLLAAGLFLCHPCLGEGVANISARTDLFAALGILAATWVWVPRPDQEAPSAWRLSLGFLGAVLFSAMAMLSKEQAIVGVALVPLFAVWAGPRRLPPWRRAVGAGLPVLLGVGLAVGMRVTLLTGEAGLALAFSPVDGLARTLRYLVLAVVPWPLSPRLSWPDAGPQVALASVAVFAGLLALAWRRRSPAAAFAVLWFLIALIPVADWFLLGVRVSPMLLYFALIGPALAVGVACRSQRAVKVLAVALLVSILAGWSWVGKWSSDLSLWGAAVAYDSDDLAARLNRANALSASGRRDAALAEYDALVSRAEPERDEWVLARGLFARANLHADMHRIDRAEPDYQAALALSGDELYQAAVNLAFVYSDRGDHTDALVMARRALTHGGANVLALEAVAVVAARAGELDYAEEVLLRALDLAPEAESLQDNLDAVRRQRASSGADPSQ